MTRRQLESFGEAALTCPQEEFDQLVDSINANLRALIRHNSLVEIRALAAGRTTLAGYYDNLLEASQHAAFLDLEGYGLYFALNPTDFYCAPWVDRYNEMGPGKALRDGDIIRRTLMLIDVDPVRPAGVCSTDIEKEAARQTAACVMDYLRGEGWPRPAVADSGNGVHLYYQIDLPADDQGLVHRLLQFLDAKFSCAAAKIDPTVGNLARVCRIPGTTNRKGVDLPDRPYRKAILLSTPDPWDTVPQELIEKLAVQAPVAPSASPPSTELAPCDPPPKQLTRATSTPSADLIERARAKLHTLPIAIEGQNGSKVCYRAACLLVIDFALTVADAFPLLREWSDRCQPPWTDKELLHKLNDAAKKAQAAPENVGSSAPSSKDSLSAAERLMEIVAARCELWRTTDDNEPYVTISMPHNDAEGDEALPQSGWHKEHFQVNSSAFEYALRHIDFEAHGRVVATQALKEAIDTTAAKARFRGKAYDTHLRVARIGEQVFLDLGTDHWDAVAVSANGWDIVPAAPCKFRRPVGMHPLPTPVREGDISLLQNLLNLECENDLKLIVGWLVAALRGKRPYPLLAIYGEQGSAKSTLSRMVRNLIDPHMAQIKCLSRNEHDLIISADNSWVIALDNVSRISEELSDSLCRMVTGVGFSTRKLYTDSDEKIFNVCRPIMLNSIGEVITRADLLDRAVVIEIPVIPETERRTDEEVADHYHSVQAQILGLLLDGVACALRNYRELNLPAKSRMADFQRWAAAAMPAFGWKSEDFLEAYAQNVEAAQGVALDSSPVVPAIRLLLKLYGGRWPAAGQMKGCEALLQELEKLPDGPKFKTQPGWPGRPNTLGGILARLAPVMRRSGIDVDVQPRRTAKPKIKPVTIINVELIVESAEPAANLSISAGQDMALPATAALAPSPTGSSAPLVSPRTTGRLTMDTLEDLERYLAE